MRQTAAARPLGGQQQFRQLGLRPARAAVSCSATQQRQEVEVRQRLPAGAALVLSAAVLLAAPGASLAKMAPGNQEVDNASSPMIQAMLKRTEEMREQRYKERLDDYYKRNFKDYFAFGGDAQLAKAQGISPETQQAIQKWLEDNK